MPAELWVSLLALMGTVVGSFGGILVSNKLVNFRLDELEKRVEKLIVLSERVAVVERDVKTAMRETNESRSAYQARAVAREASGQ